MDDVTAARWARGILRAEMGVQDIDYAALTNALAKSGVSTTEQILRDRIERAAFSAGFFFQCMYALGVDYLDFTAMVMAPVVSQGRDAMETILAGYYGETREEMRTMMEEARAVLDG